MIGDARWCGGRRASLGLALGALLVLTSCGSLLGPWREPKCEPAIVPSGELGGVADLRARIRLRAASTEIALEVVSRVQGERLVVAALTPYGTRVFALEQRGRAIEVDAADPRLGVVALWTLDALSRALFVPVDEPPQRDARVVESVWAGERVRETRLDGRRVSRTFLRGDGADVPVASIQYAAPSGPDASGSISIQNRRCGYEARLSVLDRPEESVRPRDPTGLVATDVPREPLR